MPISIPKTDVEGRKYLVWTCLNMFRLLTGPFSPSHTHRESCHGWSIVHCCACLAGRCSVAFSPTAIFGGTVAPWESSWRDPRLGVNQGTEPFSTSRTGLDFRERELYQCFQCWLPDLGKHGPSFFCSDSSALCINIHDPCDIMWPRWRQVFQPPWAAARLCQHGISDGLPWPRVLGRLPSQHSGVLRHWRPPAFQLPADISWY